MSYLIVEIKARSAQPEPIRQYLKANGGNFKGIDHQVDTYFNVPTGRLKLREGNIENNLIYYERDDQKGPKKSEVVLYNSKPDSTLKEVLSRSLGVKVVVDKKREIYFIDNVKFHIDDVVGLGSFVEIEAIDKTGKFSRDELDAQCSKHLVAFGIPETDLMSTSYSDLLLQAKGEG